MVILPDHGLAPDKFLAALSAVLVLVQPYGELWSQVKIDLRGYPEFKVKFRASETGATETARFRVARDGSVEEWKE